MSKTKLSVAVVMVGALIYGIEEDNVFAAALYPLSLISNGFLDAAENAKKPFHGAEGASKNDPIGPTRSEEDSKLLTPISRIRVTLGMPFDKQLKASELVENPSPTVGNQPTPNTSRILTVISLPVSSKWNWAPASVESLTTMQRLNSFPIERSVSLIAQHAPAVPSIAGPSLREASKLIPKAKNGSGSAASKSAHTQTADMPRALKTLNNIPKQNEHIATLSRWDDSKRVGLSLRMDMQ